MGDQEPNPRQDDFEDVSLGSPDDHQSDVSSASLQYKSASSGSSSDDDQFYDAKVPKPKNASSTGDEFISDALSSTTSYDNEAPGMRELSSESSPSVYDGSSPPRASASGLHATLEAHASLGPRLPPLLMPSGSLSGFLEVDAAPRNAARGSDFEETLSTSSAAETSSVAGASAPRAAAAPNAAPLTQAALVNNPPANPAQPNGITNGSAITNGSDSDYSNLSDYTVTLSGSDDDGQPRRDPFDLLRTMLLGDPSDSNRTADELNAQGDVPPSSSGSSELAGANQGSDISSTLSSLSSLTISDTTSSSASSSGGTASSSAGPATPRRRINLAYKAVLENHYVQLSQVLDPHVLSQGDPASRLEEECLCDGCLAKIDDKVAMCLNLLFKVFQSKCPLCGYEDRMKEYQIHCYYCCRVRNLCFHCGNKPVVEGSNVLDFNTLFSTDSDKEFFAKLLEQQRRHIVYEIYREWDITPRDIALEKVKGMLIDVLNNMKQCDDVLSVNAPI